jgi:hypothetical protein
LPFVLRVATAVDVGAEVVALVAIRVNVLVVDVDVVLVFVATTAMIAAESCDVSPMSWVAVVVMSTSAATGGGAKVSPRTLSARRAVRLRGEVRACCRTTGRRKVTPMGPKRRRLHDD